MREQPATHAGTRDPLARRVQPAPVDESVRRERAMARLILRRVGIAPLGIVLMLAFLLAPVARADAQTAPVRTTATARATILTASAILRQGRGIVISATAGPVSIPIPITVQPVVRSCDPAQADVPAVSDACRMIVYDLP